MFSGGFLPGPYRQVSLYSWAGGHRLVFSGGFLQGPSRRIFFLWLGGCRLVPDCVFYRSLWPGHTVVVGRRCVSIERCDCITM